MSKRRAKPSAPAVTAAVPASLPVPFLSSFLGQGILSALTAALLTLSFAPFGQFYLAWVALVPWLLQVVHARSIKAAFAWGWTAGLLFFGANLWWLAYITVPGGAALIVYLALWFGLIGLYIRATGIWNKDYLDPAHPQFSRRILGAIGFFAFIWVAHEYIRGTLFTGLPWAYLGHSQTPILAMCQIADLTGAYGVTFWVALVNALVALLILHRRHIRKCLPAAAAVVGVVSLVLAYGLFRLNQSTTIPGPTVMVVQSNYPQSNTGQKGATLLEILNFHLTTTDQALLRLRQSGQQADLVIWSETMMPAINPGRRSASLDDLVTSAFFTTAALMDPTSHCGLTGAIALTDYNPAALRSIAMNIVARNDEGSVLRGGGSTPPRRSFETGLKRLLDAVTWEFFKDSTPNAKAREKVYGDFYNFAHRDIASLAARNRVNLLVGASSELPRATGDKNHWEPRNSVFLYDRLGQQSPTRYDKMHLVPFGEFIPCRQSFPPLYKLFISLSPYDSDHTLAPGEESKVFAISTPPQSATPANWRFVTPICFEDIVGPLVADMFRSPTGKRADFIVNVTNDGWFRANEMPLHLQAAIFRSIENRAPTARSVNTGISGFIDSNGQTYGLVPAGQAGVSVARLNLDTRLTIYTRIGDVFAWVCLATFLALLAAAIRTWMKNRGPKGR